MQVNFNRNILYSIEDVDIGKGNIREKCMWSHTKLHRHHETDLQEYTEKDNLVLIDV